MMRRLCWTLFALLAICVSTADAQRFLEVSRTEAGFTVDAEAVTLPEVLTAIGREAGFTVHDSSPEREPIGLFEVRDAPLDSTLRQLLGTSNHLIVYRGGAEGRIEAGSIEKIVLLSPVKRERRAGTTSSLAGPTAAAMPPPEARPARASRASAAPDGLDPELEDDALEDEILHGEALAELEEERIRQLDAEAALLEDLPPEAVGSLPPDYAEEFGPEGDLPPGALPPPAIAPPP